MGAGTRIRRCRRCGRTHRLISSNPHGHRDRGARFPISGGNPWSDQLRLWLRTIVRRLVRADRLAARGRRPPTGSPIRSASTWPTCRRRRRHVVAVGTPAGIGYGIPTGPTAAATCLVAVPRAAVLDVGGFDPEFERIGRGMKDTCPGSRCARDGRRVRLARRWAFVVRAVASTACLR